MYGIAGEVYTPKLIRFRYLKTKTPQAQNLSFLFTSAPVRICDGTTRLLLIRTPRAFCARVRASLTLLTTVQEQKVSLTVLSVTGSARTAKVDAIRHVRGFYRQRLLHLLHGNNNAQREDGNTRTAGPREVDRICRSMQETLDLIVNIDY